MMRIGSVLILVLGALLLSGCLDESKVEKATEVAGTFVVGVDTAYSLADLKDSYEAAKKALRTSLEANAERLNKVIIDELTALEKDGDAFVKYLVETWDSDKARFLTEIDTTHRRGIALYERGVAVITPLADLMDTQTNRQLARLADNISAIDVAYQRYKVNPGMASAYRYARAGLQFATTVAQVAELISEAR